MSGCILSPYGTHDSQEQCTVDNQCGYKYGCSASGVPEKRADGVYDTPEECKCWSCTVAGCEVTADGTGGYGSQTDCTASCRSGYTCTASGPVLEVNGTYEFADDCKYVCDGAGGSRVRVDADAEAGVVYAAATNCYTCQGVSTPVATLSGLHGNVPSSGSACSYSCSDGSVIYDPNTTFTSGSDLKCYMCNPASNNPENPTVHDGVDGNHSVSTEQSCGYQCDGLGGAEHAGNLLNSEGSAFVDLKCYNCTGAHPYTPVDKGTMGNYDGKNEFDCRYWCDGEGNPVSVTDVEKEEATFDVGQTKETMDEVKCATCSGGPGPDSSCVFVDQGTVGSFSTLAECDQDTTAQCGHGYGCSGDECVISSTAARGRTETECKLDSVEQCGWGYGCFTKYACVDGKSCAAMDENYCSTIDGDGKLECFDTAELCTANSSCLDTIKECFESPLEGGWMIHRGDSFISMTNSPDPYDEVFTFTKGTKDGDEYQWYSSTIVDNAGVPILELGVGESLSGFGWDTSLKFKGRVAWPEGSGVFHNFYSGKSNQGASYAAPAAYKIATIPRGSDDCFVFDSIDLSEICGGGACGVEVNVGGTIQTTRMILQREELCDWRTMGPGDTDNFGRLDNAACVENTCRPLSAPISLFFSVESDNSLCGGRLGILPPCTSLSLNNLVFNVEDYNPSYGYGYKLTNGATEIELLNERGVDGALTGLVRIQMKHGTGFTARTVLDSFEGAVVNTSYATICGDATKYLLEGGSSISFSFA